MIPFPDPPETIRAALARRGVTGSFCHVWSDALFARARAREEGRLIRALESTLASEAYATRDPRTASVRERRRSALRAQIHQHRWDRGVYARNGTVSAWLAFERVAAALFEIDRRTDILAQLDVVELDRELMQSLVGLKARRDAYLYDDCDGEQLLGDELDADEAIAVVRVAVKALHEKAGRAVPVWIDGDGVPDHVGGDAAWGTTIRGDARSDPWAISIVVVHREFEWTSDLMPHDVDPWPIVLERIDSVCKPILAVRVCQGGEVCEVTAASLPALAPVATSTVHLQLLAAAMQVG
jgi:hypothetical protein